MKQDVLILCMISMVASYVYCCEDSREVKLLKELSHFVKEYQYGNKSTYACVEGTEVQVARIGDGSWIWDAISFRGKGDVSMIMNKIQFTVSAWADRDDFSDTPIADFLIWAQEELPVYGDEVWIETRKKDKNDEKRVFVVVSYERNIRDHTRPYYTARQCVDFPKRKRVTYYRFQDSDEEIE